MEKRMKITEKVILDLMPLYQAKEASSDSIEIIEEYLKLNPEFAQKMKMPELDLNPSEIKNKLSMNDEMDTLNKTKKLIRLRSFILSIAILFSALPFTFNFTSSDDGLRWLWIDKPVFAVVSALIGFSLWGIYYLLNKRLSI
jgi:hypothetical protein